MVLCRTDRGVTAAHQSAPDCTPAGQTDLDNRSEGREGTHPVRGGWDHRAMEVSRCAPYAAGTNLRGKEVSRGMLQFISTLLARFRREDEEGQTLVEYGLLLALIAIIVIVALIFLGPIVSEIFQNVGENLEGT
jgi:pilus assembly protein Flp/PilA